MRGLMNEMHTEEEIVPPIDEQNEEEFVPPIDEQNGEEFVPPIDEQNGEEFVPPIDEQNGEEFVPPIDEQNEEEFHNQKWCQSLNVIFDEMEENLVSCLPSFVNQVIPTNCSLPNGALSTDIDIEVNLHTLEKNVKFTGDFWGDESNSNLKIQINDCLGMYIPADDSNSKTAETIQNCNYFKDISTRLSKDLYFCEVSVSDAGIAEFHSKLHLLTLFYIDGASFIEYDDPRWIIFYLFKLTSSGDLILAGFCTLYNFWFFPDKVRVRISQLIIFPPFQGLSYGSLFLSSILNHYCLYENCYDITVEDPNEIFSILIDSIDIFRLQQLREYRCFIKNAADIQTLLRPSARNKLKINNERFIILCEMLALYECDNDEDLLVWTENFTNRLKKPLQLQIKRAQSIKCQYSEDIKMEIIEQLRREMMQIPEAVNMAKESYSATLIRSCKLFGLLNSRR